MVEKKLGSEVLSLKRGKEKERTLTKNWSVLERRIKKGRKLDEWRGNERE